MKRLGSLSIQFYRILLFFNVTFTLTVIFVMVLYGIPINAGAFLLAKMVGIGSAIALHNYSYKQSYFYFRNAGYHMRWVLAAAIVVDILMYVVLTLLGSLILQLWQR